MLTPRAAHLLIRHFDEIDQHFARRLSRQRPWSETALTSLLADLLDQSVQAEYDLKYGIAELNAELSAGDGLFRVTLQIETHEYPANVERWVNQSDLGMLLRLDNHFEPHRSWTQPWLFQAKRLTPSLRKEPMYSERSRFGSTDVEQHARIERLASALDFDFIRYLLYCPRPSLLEASLRRKLAYLRTQGIGNDIFDYTRGLELRDDLLREHSTLEASLFLAPITKVPRSFAEVHSGIFRDGIEPFSWFVTQQFLVDDHGRHRSGRRPSSRSPEGRGKTLAEGIVTGDPQAVSTVVEMLHETQGPDEFTFLPGHTLTITIDTGVNDEAERLRVER